MGCKNLFLLVIPHPLGGLREEEVKVLGKSLIKRLGELPQKDRHEEDCGSDPTEETIQDYMEFPQEEQAYEFYEMNGWTDGLPIILPTKTRVEKFLSALGKPSDQILGEMAPMWAQFTVEKIAINAVMAGCRPDYLPLIIKASEAILEPRFNLCGVQTTTHPCALLLIINGPIRKKLAINSGPNCFGQGWRGNATIGRAMRLILVNVAGAVPGSVDKATQGNPGKFTYCIAENEEESPWPPLHIEKGFSPGSNTVTVVAAEGPHNVNDHGSNTAEGILTTLAGTMATTGSNSLYNHGDTFVVFCPEHAATIARDGFSKTDVRRFLFDRVRVPISKMSSKQLEHLRIMSPHPDKYIDDEDTIGVCTDMAEINIVVAGGPGKHSAWIPNFLSYSVTQQI